MRLALRDAEHRRLVGLGIVAVGLGRAHEERRAEAQLVAPVAGLVPERQRRRRHLHARHLLDGPVVRAARHLRPVVRQREPARALNLFFELLANVWQTLRGPFLAAVSKPMFASK